MNEQKSGQWTGSDIVSVGIGAVVAILLGIGLIETLSDFSKGPSGPDMSAVYEETENNTWLEEQKRIEREAAESKIPYGWNYQ